MVPFKQSSEDINERLRSFTSMWARRFATLILFSLAFVACKNEPYENAPLGVVTFSNNTASTASTYRYRDQRIYTYTTTSAGTTTSTSRFNYLRDRLDRIVSDSSEAGYKITQFYYQANPTVVDSTFQYVGTTRSLIAKREVYFDGNGHPVTVMKWTFGDAPTIESAELTYSDDENVVRLINYNHFSGARVLIRDLYIGHDDKNCVYVKNPDYVYTIALTELYWLSKNNPTLFNDGTGEKYYRFSYNKFGYPSNFRSETDVVYGLSYTELRQ